MAAAVAAPYVNELSDQKSNPKAEALQERPAFGVVERAGGAALSPSPLSTLFTALGAVFTAERQAGFTIDNTQAPESFARTDAAVRSLLSAYGSAGHEDWKAHAFFNGVHYVRNLVDANDDFELIVLCWSPGQRSRIHNHDNSHCWVLGLHNEVEEVQFEFPKPNGVGELEAPKQKVVNVLGPGATTYVNDHICLHTIGCNDDVSAPGAVTLHLYTPPIKKVAIYSHEDGSVSHRTPGFYSVRGVRT